ncbi:MAG: hypothetical protein EOM24_06875 [Chloroflexia bacterium]|nr:hypothetical protein [Chloroflexia bacterium]
MNFFRRLFGGQAQQEDPALHLYVQCKRCGAPVHVRVHRYNDLTVIYDDNESVEGYHLRKEIMDARCFRLMYAELNFDRKRNELSRSIEGGEFITQETYAQLVAEQARSV